VTLLKHKVRQDTERHILGASWVDRNQVFTTSHGTAIEPHNLFDHFKAMLQKAGLPRYGFTTCRVATEIVLVRSPSDASEVAKRPHLLLTIPLSQTLMTRRLLRRSAAARRQLHRQTRSSQSAGTLIEAFRRFLCASAHLSAPRADAPALWSQPPAGWLSGQRPFCHRTNCTS
jgi:hypothetical protein